MTRSIHGQCACRNCGSATPCGCSEPMPEVRREQLVNTAFENGEQAANQPATLHNSLASLQDGGAKSENIAAINQPPPPRDDAPVPLECLTDSDLVYLAEQIESCDWHPNHSQKQLARAYRELLSYRRADQPARLVKPLVWCDEIGRGEFGAYALARVHGGSWIIYSDGSVLGGVLHGAFRQTYPTAPAAKAAAQADYERRILVALLPTEAGAEPVAWDNVYVIPRELTEEEWADVKYNVDRKADPDIPLWRIKNVVSSAHFVAGHRGRTIAATPPAAPTDNTALVEAEHLIAKYRSWAAGSGACLDIKRVEEFTKVADTLTAVLSHNATFFEALEEISCADAAEGDTLEWASNHAAAALSRPAPAGGDGSEQQ